MVTGKFGSKQFKVTGNMIYTPDGFSTSESIDIEETERSGKKPSTKVKGIKLQTASFTVLLDARFVTVDTEIQWWRNTLRAKASKDLYYGNYKIGKFYLTQVDVAETTINKNGVYTKAKITLSFTEDAGSSSGSSSNSSASSVKSSASTSSSKKVRVGSYVHIKSGTYWYDMKDNAKKKSTSGRQSTVGYVGTAYKVIAVDGSVIHIVTARSNSSSGKWIRLEDVTVVTY